jgi:hypothetical protein
MTNIVKGLLTTYGATTQVQTSYFFVVSGSGYIPSYDTSSYLFIGKVKPWLDDNNPPQPVQSQAEIKTAFKNMVAAKLLTSSNMAPVVPRVDWTSGRTYAPYSDLEDMFERDGGGNLVRQFYVRNRFDQIFKCLYNNNDNPSIVEPILQAGTTEPSQTLYSSDGYKWIYVTTINKGLKKDFFDDSWMPILPGSQGINVQTKAGLGSINAINITNGGSDYIDGFNSTIITIDGDGQGATAYANVESGSVKDIVVTNTGNNYTTATVTISTESGFTGTDATAIAVISPVGGHGTDPVSELGCRHLMISAEINGSENGLVPTDIAFRQLGIVVNPELKDGTTPKELIYNTTDMGYVSYGTLGYTIGETVYQGSDILNPTFNAEVCSFDSTNNVIYMINIEGNYSIGSPVYGESSGTTRVLLDYTKTDFGVGSGHMMYFENRTPIQRSPNGNEQLRLLLSF